MKVVYEYSHLGGSEIMQVRYKKEQKEIYKVISDIKAHKTKISKEKTKQGITLYAPIDMNEQFRRAFNERATMNYATLILSPSLTAM